MRSISKRAFTVIELVITIAVIGVLTAVLIPTFVGITEKAKEASDQSLARSLTTSLRTNNEEIADLPALEKAIDASQGEGFFQSLEPQSSNSGNHFWYNASTQTIEVKSLDEVSANADAARFDASFRSCIKSGYVLLDHKGSELANIASMMENLYSRQECDKALEYLSDKSSIASNFIDNLSNTLIINENGCLRGSDYQNIDSVYFTSDNISLNKTTFFEFESGSINFKTSSLDTPLAGAGLDNKVIPIKNTMYFGTHTLLFAAQNRITLKVDVDDLWDLRSVFGAEATNARIQINNDENTYKLIGSDLVNIATNEVAVSLFTYTIPQKVLNYEMKPIEAVSVTQDVTVSNNQVTEQTNISSETVSAIIPAGVKVDSNTLELSITPKETSEANLTLGNYASTSLDIHIEGISKGNNVPIIIDLGQVMNPNLNATAIKMHHVEQYEAVEMTLVSSLDELTQHNTYYYNSEDGNVTIAVKSFSEYDIAERTTHSWDGTYDYSWYNPDATEYTIRDENDLAGFAKIVNGEAEGEGYARSDFHEKTVTLENDLTLNDWYLDPVDVLKGLQDAKIKGPSDELTDEEERWIGTRVHSAIGMSTSSTNDAAFLGYQAGIIKPFPVIGNDSDHPFKGTFNGNNKSISGLFGLHYDESEAPKYLGLFGWVQGPTEGDPITIHHLTIRDSWYYYYHGNIGLVANSSRGKVTYDNIKIVENYTSQYNWYSGGVVGYLYPNSNTTFSNIIVDDSNIFEALWETYDAAVGGLVGEMGISATYKPKVTITNCDVYPVMNLYNDCCANYQWFAYRYSGMVIGYLWLVDGCDIDRHQYLAHKQHDPLATEEYLTMNNVKVHYGNWHNYYYYKSPRNGQPSYAGVHDWKYRRYKISDLVTDKEGNFILDEDQNVQVRAEVLTEINGILEVGVAPDKQGNNIPITKDDINTLEYIPFDQLFGGGQGFYGVNTNDLNALRGGADSGVRQDTDVLTFINGGVKTKKLAIQNEDCVLNEFEAVPNYMYQWNDGSTLYDGGDAYRVNGDATFTAVSYLKVKLDPAINDWQKDSPKFAIYALNEGETNAQWIDMVLNRDTALYEAYVPVTNLYEIVFVRINPEYSTPLDYGWTGKWNQTVDVTDAGSHVGYTYRINNAGDDDTPGGGIWVETVQYLYLNPGVWNADGARFAIYYFNNDSDNKWEDLIETNTAGKYVVVLRDGYSKCIFVRMKSGTTENGWGNSWNQTVDLTISSNEGKTYVIIGWDNSKYYWTD